VHVSSFQRRWVVNVPTRHLSRKHGKISCDLSQYHYYHPLSMEEKITRGRPL
jgi:hypothetical protein